MPHTHLTPDAILAVVCAAILLPSTIDSVHINQPDPVITASVGDNVTLNCFRMQAQATGTIVWYKQKLGREPRVMVTMLREASYEDDFKSKRFSVENDETSCRLKIALLEESDEATYYCGLLQFVTGFGNGTFLSVKGDEDDVKVSVVQSGVWDSVPTGGSRATLQCSVLSERTTAELRVLWFRSAPSQSHPQIIYTHHNNNNNNNTDQCRSSTRTCVYNISVNDTGTYYCAVVLCGRIVFGNGIPVQLERSVDPVVICLAGALGVCVLVMFTLIFIIWERRNHDHHIVRLKRDSLVDPNLNQDSRDIVEVNYAAVSFRQSTGKRGRGKEQQTKDIIYSDVRRLSDGT